MKKISYRRGIRFAFFALQKDWRSFIGVGILLALAVYVPSMVLDAGESAKEGMTVIGPLIVGLSFPIQLLFDMGLIKISLAVYDRKKWNVSDLASQYMLFFNYVIGMILYCLIILLGLIFFIFPGIYVAIRFYFFSYYIIDQSNGPLEALRSSYVMTEGKALHISGYLLVIAVFAISSLIFTYIGPIVMAMVSALAMTYLYRKIS